MLSQLIILPIHSFARAGRNSCQLGCWLGVLARMWQAYRCFNFTGFSAALSLAGRCSDHKKGISPFPRRLAAVSGPSALAAFPSREEGRSNAGDCRGVAQKSFEANPSTTPPREARFRKTSVFTGVEHSPKQPVLRANSTRCFVSWQIVEPVRRATILSGFSLRNKSIEFCAKG
jgi:hypothetical protein